MRRVRLGNDRKVEVKMEMVGKEAKRVARKRGVSSTECTSGSRSIAHKHVVQWKMMNLAERAEGYG